MQMRFVVVQVLVFLEHRLQRFFQSSLPGVLRDRAQSAKPLRDAHHFYDFCICIRSMIAYVSKGQAYYLHACTSAIG